MWRGARGGNAGGAFTAAFTPAARSPLASRPPSPLRPRRGRRARPAARLGPRPRLARAAARGPPPARARGGAASRPSLAVLSCGVPHGTRYLRHDRGWCAYGSKLPCASDQYAWPVRTVRRLRGVRVSIGARINSSSGSACVRSAAHRSARVRQHSAAAGSSRSSVGADEAAAAASHAGRKASATSSGS